MTIRLMPGVELDRALRCLGKLSLDAQNTTGQMAHIPLEALEHYLDWAVNAERSLEGIVRPTDVAVLLHSPRYGMLRTMDGAAVRLRDLVRLELDAARRRIDAEVAALKALRERWTRRRGTVFVPDTNVLLNDGWLMGELPESLRSKATDDAQVVIPLVVIDELDNLKRKGNRETKTAARKALRELEKVLALDAAGPQAGDSQMSGAVQILVDDLDHKRLDDHDNEIVDRALYLREVSGLPVTLVTDDTGMRVRALAHELSVTAFQSQSQA